MGGRLGRRYLAPLGDSQFRFLFASHQRKSGGVMRDASISWASCSRKVNDPNKPKFAQVLTRNTTYGVQTIDPPRMMKFDKPCSKR
jgi:hypothetical protein